MIKCPECGEEAVPFNGWNHWYDCRCEKGHINRMELFGNDDPKIALFGPIQFKMKYPDNVSISVKTIEKGQMELIYEETFNEPCPEAIKQTIKGLLNTMLTDGEIEMLGDTGVRFRKTGTRKDIGDYLTGEFIAWSNIGELTFKDILDRVANMALNMARYEELMKLRIVESDLKNDYGEFCNSDKEEP